MNLDFDNIRATPTLDLEVKASPTGMIEGWGATYGGTPDRQGDVIQAGAFRRTLQEHKANGTSIAMLWSHQIDQPVGKWTEVRETDEGLFVRGSINLKTTRGQEAYEHASNGDLGGFSIGYTLARNGAKALADGRMTITDANLFEVSLVAVPANPRAKITSVKSFGSRGELVEMLQDNGVPRKAAEKIAAGGYAALTGDNSDDERKALALLTQIEAAIESFRSI